MSGSSPRRAVWLVAPVAVALALLVLLLATRDPSSDRAVSGMAVGRIAPLTEGLDLDGVWFDLDQQRGRWIVVNFFSTTCVPCIDEHPELVQFSERHRPIGDALVVSVAFDDSAANVREFFADFGGDWPVLTHDVGSLAVAYGVTAVPESYLVAPSGVVAAKLVGGVTADGLDQQIADLLVGAEQ